MFVTVLSIYAAATGVISCGGWMRFWLWVFAAVRHVKAWTAISRAFEYGAPNRPRPNSAVRLALTALCFPAWAISLTAQTPNSPPNAPYLLPSSFLFGDEANVWFPAEPIKSRFIYNDVQTMGCDACAPPNSAPKTQDDAPAAEDDDTAFGFMPYLSRTGEHDLNDENWNLYGQLTTIGFFKPSFHAAYTDLNGSNSSLGTKADTSFTQTLTLYFGIRLRPGTEVYIVPEMISETTLSNLKGLGGATENFELQKTGGLSPSFYRARFFLRQTVGLGGKSSEVPSGQMQLGGNVDSRRLVFTLGNFSALDIVDINNVIGDLRRSFFDEAFMTNSAFDFPADARGYSIGAAAELYWDQWAVRLMRLVPPVEPNSQTLAFQPFKYYGDMMEFEHDHTLFGGQSGAVRLLLYRNHELMGRFVDAINAFEANPADNAANCGNLYNYGSENSTAPDLCFVRKPNVKMGVGINAEQNITPNIGVFSRAMYSDGHTEVEAYDSADRSFSVGTVLKGALWKQPLDSAGLGFGTSWISPMHARYLKMGGVDGFIGDGNLTQAHENMTEGWYSRHLTRSIFLSFDYQRAWNPGYNAVRGPVNLIGGKFHVQF
jgi:high affinity Mn2+ porin